jgi:hypothetical protein
MTKNEELAESKSKENEEMNIDSDEDEHLLVLDEIFNEILAAMDKDANRLKLRKLMPPPPPKHKPQIKHQPSPKSPKCRLCNQKH